MIVPHSQSIFGFGKVNSRVVKKENAKVKFADVAGCDEAKATSLLTPMSFVLFVHLVLNLIS